MSHFDPRCYFSGILAWIYASFLGGFRSMSRSVVLFIKTPPLSSRSSHHPFRVICSDTCQCFFYDPTKLHKCSKGQHSRSFSLLFLRALTFFKTPSSFYFDVHLFCLCSLSKSTEYLSLHDCSVVPQCWNSWWVFPVLKSTWFALIVEL